MQTRLWSVLFLFILCGVVNAQNSDINIKVFSEHENEPLLGANVLFEDLEKGAITNMTELPLSNKFQTEHII